MHLTFRPLHSQQLRVPFRTFRRLAPGSTFALRTMLIVSILRSGFEIRRESGERKEWEFVKGLAELIMR